MRRNPPAGRECEEFSAHRARDLRATWKLSRKSVHTCRVPALATKSTGRNGSAAATGGDRAKNGMAPAQQDNTS